MMDILKFPQMKKCMELVGDIYETWELLKAKLDELDRLAAPGRVTPRKAAPTKKFVVYNSGGSATERILAVVNSAPRQWTFKDISASAKVNRNTARRVLQELKSAGKVSHDGRGRYRSKNPQQIRA